MFQKLKQIYEEHSTYSSQDFIRKVIAFHPFKIELVQTDNGTEWTNALISNNSTPTLFEKELIKAKIEYKRIRVATPRHNGKVERQHRTDEARFYGKLRMYSLEDGRKQLARYNRFSNTIPKVCLNYKSPNEVLISDCIIFFRELCHPSLTTLQHFHYKFGKNTLLFCKK